MNSLQGLLPQRRPRPLGGGKPLGYTGFTVRSYRNPCQAELLSEFPDSDDLPANMSHPPRPYVPGPYFFKYYSQTQARPVTGASSRLRGRLTRIPASAKASELEQEVAHVFGTNSRVAKSLHQKKLFPSFHPSVYAEYADIRKAWNTGTRTGHSPREKSVVGDATVPELCVVARSMPPEDPTSLTDRKTSKSQELDAAGAITAETQQHFDQLPDRQINEDMDKKNCDTTKAKGSAPLAKHEDIPAPEPEVVRESSPKPPIMISLDNEDGESKIVDIDADDDVTVTPPTVEVDEPEEQENKENVEEPEERPPPEHRLTATKSRSSEAIVASFKENAEQRQKDFEKLLDEHAVLVQEITRASSSDNLTQENTRE